MSVERIISTCGLNCAVCEFYKAGHEDQTKQQEIIDWFKKDYDKDITPEQTMCLGCHGPKETHWSPDCWMMNCAEEKGVKICIECPDFICEKLDTFTNDGSKIHHRTVENMKEMKQKGLESWKNDKLVFCP